MKETSMRKWLIPALGVALALHGVTAAAQSWPTKPIRLVIGFPPGGGADTVARPVADALSQELGQPVIVDNKPGGGTTIAATTVATAAPDGYTLYMSNASLYGSLQAIYKDFKHPIDDYRPIALWVTGPMLLTVSAGLGVDSVQQLIARAKAEPGKLNYASSGVGGGTHLPGLLFTRLAGVDIEHVPYKGGAPALAGVASGETQMSFATPPSALPLAKAGRLKVLAVTTGKRSPLFPDLPTIAEAGVAGYDYGFWYGLFAPAGTPDEIVQRLFEASNKVLAQPALKEKLAASGNEVATLESPAAFAAWAAKSGKTELELTKASGAAAQ
ncbi:MAG: tripartite tricarboxylate transporter substrate binding protein [Burkholderiaceae bacterium]